MLHFQVALAFYGNLNRVWTRTDLPLVRNCSLLQWYLLILCICTKRTGLQNRSIFAPCLITAERKTEDEAVYMHVESPSLVNKELWANLLMNC